MSVIAPSTSNYKRCTGQTRDSQYGFVRDIKKIVNRGVNFQYKTMYHHIIFLSNLLIMVLAADKPIAIISQSQDISPDGSFSTRWESANGIAFQEEGFLKNPGQKDAEAEEVRGSASWTAPDGTKLNLDWLANENGATFQGAHLPTPPPTQPIPVLIQRALDWIAKNPSNEGKNRL